MSRTNDVFEEVVRVLTDHTSMIREQSERISNLETVLEYAMSDTGPLVVKVSPEADAAWAAAMRDTITKSRTIVDSPPTKTRRTEAFKEVLNALGKADLSFEDRKAVLEQVCRFFSVKV